MLVMVVKWYDIDYSDHGTLTYGKPPSPIGSYDSYAWWMVQSAMLDYQSVTIVILVD